MQYAQAFFHTVQIFPIIRQQSPKKVGEDIQKATMEWKGIKVMVRLSVVNRVVSKSLYWFVFNR